MEKRREKKFTRLDLREWEIGQARVTKRSTSKRGPDSRTGRKYITIKQMRNEEEGEGGALSGGGWKKMNKEKRKK